MTPGVVREGPRTYGTAWRWQVGRDHGTNCAQGAPWDRPLSWNSPTHLLEVRGRLHLAHGLHERVPHDDADVGPRIALSLACQLLHVGLRQAVRGVAQVQLEHLCPCCLLGQRDVDPLLKPAGRAGGRQGEPPTLPDPARSRGGLWPAHLLLMAESSTQGMLVAPSTRIPSLLFPTPAQGHGQGQLSAIHRELWDKDIQELLPPPSRLGPPPHPACAPGTPSLCAAPPHSRSRCGSCTASPLHR